MPRNPNWTFNKYTRPEDPTYISPCSEYLREKKHMNVEYNVTNQNYEVSTRTDGKFNCVYTAWSVQSDLLALKTAQAAWPSSFANGQRVLVRNLSTNVITEYVAQVPQAVTFTRI